MCSAGAGVQDSSQSGEGWQSWSLCQFRAQATVTHTPGETLSGEHRTQLARVLLSCSPSCLPWGSRRALYTPLPSSPCQGSHGGSSPGGHEGSRRGGRGREPRQEKVLGSSRTPEAWRGVFFIITPLSSKVQPPPALS